MPVGASFQLAICAPSDVATPPVNKVAYFANSADGNKPYWKDSSGSIFALSGPTGSQGAIGPSIALLEDTYTEDPLLIPGPKGADGVGGGGGGGTDTYDAYLLVLTGHI